MTPEKFKQKRYEIISKMLENPDDAGIFPTAKCYEELDNLFEEVKKEAEYEEQWGVGKRKDEKAYDTIKIGETEYELIHGEHPHSRRDNTTYARNKENPESITGFDGHRICFKIELEETNYYKSSGLSGDEIRKGGSVKVFANGVQVWDEFARNYENGYRMAHNFIIDMEQNWGWFPKDCKKEIGRVVGYNEQLFKIESFVVSQSCVILATIDGKPRKRFLYEDLDEDIDNETLKVELTSPQLTWFPEYEGKPKDQE